MSMNKAIADEIAQSVMDGDNVTLSFSKDAVNPWRELYEGPGWYVVFQVTLSLLSAFVLATAVKGLRQELSQPAKKKNASACQRARAQSLQLCLSSLCLSSLSIYISHTLAFCSQLSRFTRMRAHTDSLCVVWYVCSLFALTPHARAEYQTMGVYL